MVAAFIIRKHDNKSMTHEEIKKTIARSGKTQSEVAEAIN